MARNEKTRRIKVRTIAISDKMTDEEIDKEIDRLLYTIITVVSVIVFTVYKMWGCL
jgi:hypothetical protein